MNRVRALWMSVRSSLWFVPTLMVASSIGLAVALVEIDKRYNFHWANAYPLLFGAGAAGSRGMLSTIAGSMITVAGVTFSLTIAALVTAAGQYTSRILRNFMRDQRNQVVLGSFVGIFTYCLVVLRTIRAGDEQAFVPSLAVFAGLLLALLGIGVLVFFIHHIATSIQASTIIARITEETLDAMQRMYPAPLETAGDLPGLLAGSGQGAFQEAVASTRMGYVQRIDVRAILAAAEEHGLTVRLTVCPGDFVCEGTRIMTVEAPAPIAEDLRGRLAAMALAGRVRTIDEDFGFGIRQLVDIALKALSPGINDTTTATMCIDHLGAILAGLAPRAMPRLHRGADRRARVLATGPTFEDMLETAFDPIRECSKGNALVARHLMGAIGAAAAATADAGRRGALQRQLALVAAHADRGIEVEHDRANVRGALARAAVELHLDPLEWEARLPARPS